VKRRVGVLLTGCGCYDGTDPHEAVLAMFAVQRAGNEVVPVVLDAPQLHAVDHTTGQELEGATRSQMLEAARLVRGRLYPLAEISPKLLDGLILPGGQGAVKNLLNGFGTPEEARPAEGIGPFLLGAHQAGAVIGAISLSEFVVAAVFGPWPHGKGCFDLGPEEVLVDEERGLLLTPGHTVANSLVQLAAGIENLCSEMWKLLDRRDSTL
jgi:enhancing lycopene biosynthesis protein 2